MIHDTILTLCRNNFGTTFNLSFKINNTSFQSYTLLNVTICKTRN